MRWQWNDSSRHRIQVDIGRHGEQRFLVEDGNRLETSFEKRPRTSILLIRKSSEWFLEALHEPTQIQDAVRVLLLFCVLLPF